MEIILLTFKKKLVWDSFQRCNKSYTYNETLSDRGASQRAEDLFVAVHHLTYFPPQESIKSLLNLDRPMSHGRRIGTWPLVLLMESSKHPVKKNNIILENIYIYFYNVECIMIMYIYKCIEIFYFLILP